MKKMISRWANGSGTKELSSLSRPKRKRVVPLWRRPKTVFAGAILALALLGVASTWVVETGWGIKALTMAKSTVIKTSIEFGLTVEEVLVTGRVKTARTDLLSALGVVRGAPILAYDFKAAKIRVEGLPWVKYARIERLLPDTLSVHLMERRPIALWQNKGIFSVIDEDGEVIATAQLSNYVNYIHVVGADAPNRVGGLLELLETQPNLKSKVAAAVRVGGRRWDLMMMNGINVRLPENGAPKALARLVAFETQSGVLERDVKVLDFRLPDRVIIRRAPHLVAKSKPPLSGQET